MSTKTEENVAPKWERAHTQLFAEVFSLFKNMVIG